MRAGLVTCILRVAKSTPERLVPVRDTNLVSLLFFVSQLRNYRSGGFIGRSPLDGRSGELHTHLQHSLFELPTKVECSPEGNVPDWCAARTNRPGPISSTLNLHNFEHLLFDVHVFGRETGKGEGRGEKEREINVRTFKENARLSARDVQAVALLHMGYNVCCAVLPVMDILEVNIGRSYFSV